MALKVVDRFTTQDGEWFFNPSKPYSIGSSEADEWGDKDIPGKGGASHIFVKAPFRSNVLFYTTDGNKENEKTETVGSTGWVNFPMWKSAAFWGVQNGPWAVKINGVEIAKGLGLPEGFHVSTFLIVDDIDEGSQPDTPPTIPTDRNLIQIVVKSFINGELTKEEIVWQS